MISRSSEHGDPWRHHFIPAAYIARWKNQSGQVCQFSRQQGQIVAKRQHPNATGFQRDLYWTEGQNFEVSDFKEIDTKGNEAIRFIIGQSGVLNISEQTIAHLCTFIMSLTVRSPENVSLYEKMLRKHLREMKDDFEVEYDAERSNDSLPYREEMLKLSPEVNLKALTSFIRTGLSFSSIKSLRFSVLAVPETSCELLTSDFPVILSRIPFQDAQLFLPLAPKKLLMGFRDYSVYLSACLRNQHELSTFINRSCIARAARYVWATSDDQLAFVRRHFGAWQHDRH